MFLPCIPRVKFGGPYHTVLWIENYAEFMQQFTSLAKRNAESKRRGISLLNCLNVCDAFRSPNYIRTNL